MRILIKRRARSASRAFVQPARPRKLTFQSSLVFPPQVVLAHAEVHMVPRQGFALIARAIQIIRHVHAGRPQRGRLVAAVGHRSLDDVRDPPVTAREIPLHHRKPRAFTAKLHAAD